jgi:hypothetical protein
MSAPTIDRDGRDALVELMGFRFFVKDETGLADEHPDEAPFARYRDDLQLMTDLAWLPRRWLIELEMPEADQAEFGFTLEPDRLRRALRRVGRYAEEACRCDPTVSDEQREVFEQAASACSRVLDELERQGGDR